MHAEITKDLVSVRNMNINATSAKTPSIIDKISVIFSNLYFENNYIL